MHPSKKEALLQKGWTEEQVKKAEALLEQTEKKDIFFSKITFWSALVVIIFANIIVSLVLIPFLIVLNQYILYLLTIILAGTIGFLYNLLITDIRHLERKHHLAAGIIVPILTIANLIIITLIANRFITDLKVDNIQHNPYIIGVVFAVAFILPYIIDRIRGKHLFYKES